MTTPSVWDMDRHPWVTFADDLRVDAIFRRQDAMRAIIEWRNASPSLVSAAYEELERADGEGRDWDEAIDTIEATWFEL